MWLQLRRLLLLCLAFTLPLQQLAIAAMPGCDPAVSPTGQTAHLARVTAEAETLAQSHHCHDATQTWQDGASPHCHPVSHSGSGHSPCPCCAGAGTTQLAPPTPTLPSVCQYALARLGPAQAWRVQFLTSGPDRPPRTLAV